MSYAIPEWNTVSNHIKTIITTITTHKHATYNNNATEYWASQQVYAWWTILKAGSNDKTLIETFYTFAITTVFPSMNNSSCSMCSLMKGMWHSILSSIHINPEWQKEEERRREKWRKKHSLITNHLHLVHVWKRKTVYFFNAENTWNIFGCVIYFNHIRKRDMCHSKVCLSKTMFTGKTSFCVEIIRCRHSCVAHTRILAPTFQLYRMKRRTLPKVAIYK